MTTNHLQEKNTFFDLMCYKKVSSSAKLYPYYKSADSNNHTKKEEKVIFRGTNPEFEIALCMHKLWEKAIEYTYYGKHYYNTDAYNDLVTYFPNKFEKVSYDLLQEFTDELIKTCMAIPTAIKETLEDGTDLYYKPFDFEIADDEIHYYIKPNKQAKDFYYRNTIEPKDITEALWSIGVTGYLIERGEFKDAIKKLNEYFHFIQDETEDIDKIFKNAQFNPEIIVDFDFTRRLNKDIKEIGDAKNISSSWNRIFEQEPDISWSDDKKNDFYVLQKKITEYPAYNNDFISFLKKATEKCKQLRIDYLRNSYKRNSNKNILKIKNNLCTNPNNVVINNVVEFVECLLFKPETCNSLGFPLREHSILDNTKEIFTEEEDSFEDIMSMENMDYKEEKRAFYDNVYNDITEKVFAEDTVNYTLADYFIHMRKYDENKYREITRDPNFLRGFLTGVYNYQNINATEKQNNQTKDIFSFYEMNLERINETFVIPIMYDLSQRKYTKYFELQNYKINNFESEGIIDGE